MIELDSEDESVKSIPIQSQVSIKQFIELMNSPEMYTFNQVAYVNNQYVLNAILQGIQL